MSKNGEGGGGRRGHNAIFVPKLFMVGGYIRKFSFLAGTGIKVTASLRNEKLDFILAFFHSFLWGRAILKVSTLDKQHP